MKKKTLIILLFSLVLIFSLIINLDYITKKIDDKNLHFIFFDKLSNFIDFDFKSEESKKILSNKKKINLKIFANDLLRYRFYLSQNKKNIFLISKEGIIFYISKDELINEDNFEIKRIKTNLSELIGQKYILQYRSIIKGITIIENKLFISYLSNNKGCFTNAIAHGKLNLNEINFSSLIRLNECKKIFNYSVGGNIVKYKEDMLILTTGDFQVPENFDSTSSDENHIIINKVDSDPQNKSSFFGKILSIDLKTRNIEIISMGHRNPQGLYYDPQNDLIFSTDHGPKGGDEINVDIYPKKNKIKNYGWPKSSYGVRYDEDINFIDESCSKELLVKIAPLCKSHKNFGFEEPLKFFTPSIGITQLLRISKLEISNFHELLIASMGYDKEEDDMTLHFLKLNKSFKVIDHEKFYVGERIRDMIDLKNDYILISLESSPPPSLGLIKIEQ